jgi:hypothetical protein
MYRGIGDWDEEEDEEAFEEDMFVEDRVMGKD